MIPNETYLMEICSNCGSNRLAEPDGEFCVDCGTYPDRESILVAPVSEPPDPTLYRITISTPDAVIAEVDLSDAILKELRALLDMVSDGKSQSIIRQRMHRIEQGG